MPTTMEVPLGLPKVIDQIPVPRLNPTGGVDEQRLVVMTMELAAIKRRQLRSPVASLPPQRGEILASIDFLSQDSETWPNT